jgi:hypothetical protein
MQSNRPNAITVAAVLSFVFAFLGFFCVCLDGITLVVLFNARATQDPFLLQAAAIAEATDRIPGYLAVEITRYALFLVNSILLLIAGVGLLSVRNWARVLSLIYAISMILIELGHLIYVVSYVHPVLKDMPDFLWSHPGSLTAETINAAFICGYGVMLLTVLLLPHVSAAFAGQSTNFYDIPDEDLDDASTG